MAAASADERFDALADTLLPEPEVTEGTGFGKNPGLRVGGKIFAMVFEGELVLKLPADRCAALVEEGGARPFGVGDRQMREWVSLAPDGPHDWDALAREALGFVRR